MIYLTAITLILMMAALARAAGGGLGCDKPLQPTWFSTVPEVLFALPFGLMAYTTAHLPWEWANYAIGVVGWAWSWMWMESGHSSGFQMGKNITTVLSKPSLIGKYVALPICRLFGWTPGELPYCFIFMGTKGLLIGLPAYPFGLLLVVLWPMAYWLGMRSIHYEPYAEWLSGGSAGAVIVANMLIPLAPWVYFWL